MREQAAVRRPEPLRLPGRLPPGPRRSTAVQLIRPAAQGRSTPGAPRRPTTGRPAMGLAQALKARPRLAAVAAAHPTMARRARPAPRSWGYPTPPGQARSTLARPWEAARTRPPTREPPNRCWTEPAQRELRVPAARRPMTAPRVDSTTARQEQQRVQGQAAAESMTDPERPAHPTMAPGPRQAAGLARANPR